MALLDVAVETVAESLASARNSLASEYSELTREDGTAVSPHKDNNLLYPLGNVLGRLANTLLIQMRELASQATPFGATGGVLDQWLEGYGVAIPAESIATGTVALTGTDETLPAGTELIAQAGSFVFTLDSAVAFGPSEETINAAVTAAEPGASYNLATGDLLAVGTLLDGVNPTATWVSLTVAGRDPASETEKTALLQTRLQQGNGVIPVRSYRQLALLFDITFAEVYIVPAGKGAGTVVAYPTLQLPDATEQDAPWTVLLPTAGQVSALETYLQRDDVRAPNDRMSAELLSLTETTFDVSITPDTADTRTAVEEALARRLAEDYTASGYTIANSELSAAIGALAAVTSHTLNDVGGGGALADVSTVVGELATIGTVTFS
jgi:hypothetical protein